MPDVARIPGQDPDNAQRPAAAAAFFLLVFAFSVRFYLIGMTGWRLPGLPMMPLSALMGFVPMVAAMVLVARSGRGSAVFQLLARLFDPISCKGVMWLVLAVIFMPVVCLIEYGVLAQRGMALPAVRLETTNILFLLAAFLIGAIGEELGWQGYAYPALRHRYTALVAALITGVVWAAWHILPFVQLGRRGRWIMWHSLSAVALRMIIIWLFEASGQRMLISVVFHAMINLSWAVFPAQGSAYDPFIAFLILAPTATVAALVGMPGNRRVAFADGSDIRTGDP